MLKPTILVAPVLLLAACAGPPPRQAHGLGDPEALRSAGVAMALHAPPKFQLLKPSTGVLSLMGLVDNDLVGPYHIADPARTIAAGLADALRDQYGARVLAHPLAVGTEDTARIAESARSVARYVIDVRTARWAVMYFPLALTRYHVMYRAEARIIDAATGAVLGEGSCILAPPYTDAAPTRDELLADDAARLKTDLAQKAADCTASLRRGLLGL